MKLKPRIKKLWIAALRSGKYEQCKGALHRVNGGYCCLGVLTQLYIKENKLKWKKGTRKRTKLAFDNEQEFVPKTVQTWANINVNGSYGYYGDKDLAEDNDNGLSFEDIANIIEKKF